MVEGNDELKEFTKRFEPRSSVIDLPKKSEYDKVVNEITGAKVVKEKNVFKRLYYWGEDKWYSLVEALHLESLVDNIDRVVPSFPLAIVLFLLIVGLVVFLLLPSTMTVTFNFYKGSNQITTPLDVVITYKGNTNNYNVENGILELKLKKGSEIELEIKTKGYEVKKHYLIENDSYRVNVPVQELSLQTAPENKVLIKIFKPDRISLFSDPVSVTLKCVNTNQTQTLTVTREAKFEKPDNCGNLNLTLNVGGYAPVDTICNSNICNVYLQRLGSVSLQPAQQPETNNLIVYVKDQEGNPLSGFSVSVNNVGSLTNVVPAQLTNELGYVQFMDLELGTYDIIASNSEKGLTEKKTITLTSGAVKSETFVFNITKRSIATLFFELRTEDNNSCLATLTLQQDSNIYNYDVNCNSDFNIPLFSKGDYNLSIVPKEPYSSKYAYIKDEISVSGNTKYEYEIKIWDAKTDTNVLFFVKDDFGNKVSNVDLLVKDKQSSFSKTIRTDSNGYANLILKDGNYNVSIVSNCLDGNLDFNTSLHPDASGPVLIKQDVNLEVKRGEAKVKVYGLPNSTLKSYINSVLKDESQISSNGYKTKEFEACNYYYSVLEKEGKLKFYNHKFFICRTGNDNFYNLHLNQYTEEDFANSKVKFLGVYNKIDLSEEAEVLNEGDYYFAFDVYATDDFSFDLVGSNIKNVYIANTYSLNSNSLTVNPEDVNAVYRVVLKITMANDIKIKFTQSGIEKSFTFYKGLRFSCDNVCIDVFYNGEYLGSDNSIVYLGSDRLNKNLVHRFYSKDGYNGNVNVKESRQMALSVDDFSLDIIPKSFVDKNIKVNFRNNETEGLYRFNFNGFNKTITYSLGKRMYIYGIPKSLVRGVEQTITPKVLDEEGNEISNYKLVVEGYENHLTHNPLLNINKQQRTLNEYFVIIQGKKFAVKDSLKLVFKKEGYKTESFTIDVNDMPEFPFSEKIVDIDLLGDYEIVEKNNRMYAKVDFNLDLNNLTVLDYYVRGDFVYSNNANIKPAFDINAENLPNLNSLQKGLPWYVLVDLESIRDLKNYDVLKGNLSLNFENPDLDDIKSITIPISFRIKLGVPDCSVKLKVLEPITTGGYPTVFIADNEKLKLDLNVSCLDYITENNGKYKLLFKLRPYEDGEDFINPIYNFNNNYLAPSFTVRTLNLSSNNSTNTNNSLLSTQGSLPVANNVYIPSRTATLKIDNKEYVVSSLTPLEVYLEPENTQKEVEITNADLGSGEWVLEVTLQPTFEYLSVLRDFPKASKRNVKLNTLTSDCLEITFSPELEPIDESINYYKLASNTSSGKITVKNNCGVDIDVFGITFVNNSFTQTKIESFSDSWNKTITHDYWSGAYYYDFKYKNKLLKRIFLNVQTSKNLETDWYIDDAFVNENYIVFLKSSMDYTQLKLDGKNIINGDNVNSYQKALYFEEQVFSLNNNNLIEEEYLVLNSSGEKHYDGKYITFNYTGDWNADLLNEEDIVSQDKVVILGRVYYWPEFFEENFFPVFCPPGFKREYLKYSSDNENVFMTTRFIFNLKNRALIVKRGNDNTPFDLNFMMVCSKEPTFIVNDENKENIWNDYRVHLESRDLFNEGMELNNVIKCANGGYTGENVLRMLAYDSSAKDKNCEENVCSAYFFLHYLNYVLSDLEDGTLTKEIYLMDDNFSESALIDMTKNHFGEHDPFANYNFITVTDDSGNNLGKLGEGKYILTLQENEDELHITLEKESSIYPPLQIYKIPYNSKTITFADLKYYNNKYNEGENPAYKDENLFKDVSSYVFALDTKNKEYKFRGVCVSDTNHNAIYSKTFYIKEDKIYDEEIEGAEEKTIYINAESSCANKYNSLISVLKGVKEGKICVIPGLVEKYYVNMPAFVE